MTDKRQRDEYELVGMVDAIRCQRDEEELPNSPPPGPKWKARKALSRLNLNGAEHDVMECLVDRANKDSGLCYPSEVFISGWTNRPLRTVQRAIDSLKRKRLISVVYRGSTSSRYYINWRRVFAAARQMEAFEKRHAASRRPKVADRSVKSGGPIPARSGVQTMEGEGG
jgi:Helix-turn-helix domain